MTVKHLRMVGPALLLAGLILLSLSLDARAQTHGRGNARVMDLSLQYDPAAGKVACLGTPDTLKVGRGETLVFRAVGTFVNDVRWANDAEMQGGPMINDGKPNLAQGGKTHSDEFERGAAFAIRINQAIERGTIFNLEVKCGGVEDGPPVIIVDP